MTHPRGGITLPMDWAGPVAGPFRDRFRRSPMAPLTPLTPLTPLKVSWALFAFGVVSFCLHSLWGPVLGIAEPLVALGGSATCGLAWLYARALFRPPVEREIWPRALVGALVMTAAVIMVMGPATGPHAVEGAAADIRRIALNIHILTSSTVLLLALIEPFEAYRRQTVRAERRFRLIFAAGYGLIFAVAVLWIRGADQGGLSPETATLIKVACALIALAGATAALRFRVTHPLSAPATSQKVRAGQPSGPGGAINSAAPVAEADQALGAKINAVLGDPEIFTRADLKLADLARLVGQPEYKVTQCITGVLGFRNFNRLVNQFRIEEAKRRLADPRWDDHAILTIAIESGFGSVGPFNRAFKEQTGMTPGRYRTASREKA